MSIKNGFESMTKIDFSEPTNPDKPVEYGELLDTLKSEILELEQYAKMMRDFGHYASADDATKRVEQDNKAITAIKTLQAENERVQDDKEALLNCLKTCLFGSIDLNKNQLFAEYKRHRPHTKQQLKKQY